MKPRPVEGLGAIRMIDCKRRTGCPESVCHDGHPALHQPDPADRSKELVKQHHAGNDFDPADRFSKIFPEMLFIAGP